MEKHTTRKMSLKQKTELNEEGEDNPTKLRENNSWWIYHSLQYFVYNLEIIGEVQTTVLQWWRKYSKIKVRRNEVAGLWPSLVALVHRGRVYVACHMFQFNNLSLSLRLSLSSVCVVCVPDVHFSVFKWRLCVHFWCTLNGYTYTFKFDMNKKLLARHGKSLLRMTVTSHSR